MESTYTPTNPYLGMSQNKGNDKDNAKICVDTSNRLSYELTSPSELTRTASVGNMMRQTKHKSKNSNKNRVALCVRYSLICERAWFKHHKAITTVLRNQQQTP